MKHGSPNPTSTPSEGDAVRELQRLSVWLLGLTDGWTTMVAQRGELAHSLLQRLLADGQGGALQALHHGLRIAGPGTDAAEVLATLDEAAQAVARTIMAAWLLGRYLPPAIGGADGEAAVMGPGAYRQSLVWHLIGATPMGVPQDGLNPWASAPQVVA